MELTYPYICENKSEIPEDAIPYLDKHIIESLNGGLEELFPAFYQTFKRTCGTIEQSWEPPKLVLKKVMQEWISYVVVQSESRNLFFNLQPEFVDKEGFLFDEVYMMLPTKWKEVYRWFNSFCVTDQHYNQRDWWNTPFRFEARLSIDDYKEGSGASKKQMEGFVQAIGCKKEMLRCWLLTESEDALFINEEACDGKVYHVKGRDLHLVTEVVDPTEKLDMYLAHYLSTLNPKNFLWK